MILVTGSNGYIGQNLLSYVKNNCRLVLRKKLSNHNNEYETFIISEFSRNTNWFGAFEDISCVIHLASIAHHNLSKYTADSSAIFEVNTEGTLNLALSAAKHGVKRFIFISSIGVNGNSSIFPFCESDVPMPTEPYAMSKMKAELGLIAISKEYEMEVVIIRPPLVYGANAPGNFSKLVKLANSCLPLPFGSINNQRSFISVSNLIDFIILCTHHPKAANELFLISDGEDISSSNFLKLIRFSLGRKSLIIPFPNYILKMLALILNKHNEYFKFSCNLQINITKAKDLLDWQPKYSIQNELKNLL